MKNLLLLTLALFICATAFTQQNNNGNTETDNTIYVIDDIDYDITGRTKQYAIRQKIELKLGEEITGLANFEKFIQMKREDLYNQRVLDTTSIDYTIGEVREDGKYPVRLLITAKDSWNIIPMPYPKYDSNSGFELIFKIRDYNFLGTMNPLRIDLGYQRDENNLNFYNVMVDYDFPFEALGLFWNIDTYNNVEYRPDLSEYWHFEHRLGLSVKIPVKTTTIEIGVSETYIANEEIRKKERYLYGDVHHGYYLSTNPYISWRIPTGLEISKYGVLEYNTSISSTINHEFKKHPLPHYRIGPWISFNHSLGFGRINWVDNFREGISASISNGYTYDFYEKKEDRDPLSYNIQVKGQYHKIYLNRLGFYTRALYRQYWNTTNEDGGDVLRGVIDDELDVDKMFSLNLDLAIGIMKFRPSEWFNSPKLRVIDFDMIASPFIDIGVFKSPLFEIIHKDESFSYRSVIICGGLEVILYSKFMRNLYIRGSFGINMSKISGLKSRELFIGTELHF